MDKFDQEYQNELERIKKQKKIQELYNEVEAMNLPKLKSRRMRGFIRKAVKLGYTVNLNALAKFNRETIMKLSSSL